MSRIAIVDEDRCRPSKCRQECKRSCPVNASGKQCIEIADRKSTGSHATEKTVSQIAESLCIGCGICVGKCPFNAITIIKTVSPLPEIVHRYGANSFRLCNLPMPRRSTVLGLLGQNGVGKSTALMILAGKLIPNFGRDETDKKNVIKHYRGTELQNFFNFLYGSKTPRVVVKPQYVESVRSSVKGTVKECLDKLVSKGIDMQQIIAYLELDGLMSKSIDVLSGGELQRFAIGATLVQDADIYMFDEPSSFLDVKQRMNMARCIRDVLLPREKYVIAVEHDITILDYLSDHICCLYGQPGAYGIVSPPFTCGEGINNYLDGFIPTDNTRFRKEPIDYRVALCKDPALLSAPVTSSSSSAKNEIDDEKEIKEEIRVCIDYPALQKTYPSLTLAASAGQIRSSEIICLVGANATGKTTFIKMLCGKLEPDSGCKVPVLNVSYKPQIIEPSYKGTVEQLLYGRIAEAMANSQFKSDVLKPMDIERLFDHTVPTLSGGEIQRVAIVLALGKPADVYLLDEPSCYLDVEQRLIVAKAIKRFITNSHRYCFIVEHDFIMSTYLADRVIVFDKDESKNDTIPRSLATSPIEFVEGFNTFLASLQITFRRSKFSLRPRINKQGSLRDREQKRSGQYFVTEDVKDPIKSFTGPSTLEW